MSFSLSVIVGPVLVERRVALRRGVSSIVVTRLDANDDGTVGPAEKAGLQIGDELLEVNGEEMRSLPQARASLRSASAADGGPEACVELLFRRAPAGAAADNQPSIR